MISMGVSPHRGQAGAAWCPCKHSLFLLGRNTSAHCSTCFSRTRRIGSFRAMPRSRASANKASFSSTLMASDMRKSPRRSTLKPASFWLVHPRITGTLVRVKSHAGSTRNDSANSRHRFCAGSDPVSAHRLRNCAACESAEGLRQGPQLLPHCKENLLIRAGHRGDNRVNSRPFR